MNQYFKIFVIIVLGILVSNFYAFAVSDQVDVELEVETGVSPTCNNNGVCESARGETEANCPADCGCNNNGVCESARGETEANCPLDCPAEEEESDHGGGVPVFDTTPPIIFNLLISEITLNSVIINWDTNEQSLCQLFFGETQEYKKETITETVFFRKHSTKLIGLSPETIYHFKITCEDTNRNQTETTNQKFTTLSLPDITPPLNITNFEAIPGDEQIELKWQNPLESDFKGVKIMRSTEFYPSNPNEGIAVYNSKRDRFLDINLVNGIYYYYTAFTYDKTGNYSSGAIIATIPQKSSTIPPVMPPVKPPIGPPSSEIEGITLNDFDFLQEENKLPLGGEGEIKLKEKYPLTISIDYEKVPEVLKTIMITLKKDDKYFSFLLRINKEKTKYLATIVPPETGIYPLNLHILDFKNQTLKTISGQLEIKGIESVISFTKISWYKQKLWLYIIYIIVVIAFLIGIVLIKKFKKKQRN